MIAIGGEIIPVANSVTVLFSMMNLDDEENWPVFARAREVAAQNGGDEPAVVEAFVRAVERNKEAFGPAVNIQAAFVHQRPYALFRQPAQICGASRCDLFHSINDLTSSCS